MPRNLVPWPHCMQFAPVTYINRDTVFSDRGFSLVEMLIAVAILSLLSLTIVVASTGSVRLFQRGVSLSMKTAEVMRTQVTISELLANALTRRQHSNAQFLGEKHAISWTARPVGFPDVQDTLHFELSLEPQIQHSNSFTEVFDLVLSWKTFGSPGPKGRTVLAKGLGELKFEYANAANESEAIPRYPVKAIPDGVWLRSKNLANHSTISDVAWPDLYVKFRHH